MSRIAACIAAALLAAALAGPAQARRQPTPAPVGVIEPACKGGLNFGHAAMVRNHLGCILVKAAGVDRAAPDRAEAIAGAFTGKLGRATIRSVGDELITRWAADPASGLVARDGFEALRFEDVELPSDMEDHVPFRGVLVARENGAEVRHEVTGAITLTGGVFRLTELEIGPAR